ncbi:sigma factor-like helix-turn-helix DNA-binding protein [Streptomyces candidus]|uniref:RNA polymerase sigma-70 region 4 domain-containing protein n=1 Tax=Streptomyces candidus TaxID=67283 RepID=A0A7X0HFC6_9ACTN|nr:sigma factor-like helix-turn-helix DNA-binding protein [Streptomyces candidus]MBB6435143.1 hypothetical protein [Streptomyces candidus]GHH40718.1 DNA-directed RNA polymerase sigma-70 factor [Streptomyces candidus]
MREREAARRRCHEAEFEAFVAGAAGRLLHTATLLTAEPAAANPRAQQLLAAALASTYAHWAGLRGEDPYDRTRQDLVARFARGAWRDWHLWRLRQRLHLLHRRPDVAPLETVTPRERLVMVLRLYEGVAEEQTAAQLGLPLQRVRTLCNRAVSQLYEAHLDARTKPRQSPPEPQQPHGTRGPRGNPVASHPKGPQDPQPDARAPRAVVAP